MPSAATLACQPDLRVGLVEQSRQVAQFATLQATVGERLRFDASDLALALAQGAYFVAGEFTARQCAFDAMLLAGLALVDFSSAVVHRRRFRGGKTPCTPGAVMQTVRAA